MLGSKSQCGALEELFVNAGIFPTKSQNVLRLHTDHYQTDLQYCDKAAVERECCGGSGPPWTAMFSSLDMVTPSIICK